MYKVCRTEQSAARQRELEQGLLDAMLQQRYEDISVSDLCQRLGVPRKSFYRYFSGKDGALYALIDHALMDFEGFTRPAYGTGKGSQLEDMETVFVYWKQHSRLLDALERSGLSGILVQRAVNYTQTDMLLSQFMSRDERELRDYVIQFAVCGLMSLMVQWHHEGFAQSPAHMARVAVRLLGKPLFPKVEQYFE